MDSKQRAKLLNQLSTELAQILGVKLDQVLLYGSYARGKRGLTLDLDILIVMQGGVDYAALIRQTFHLIARLSLDNDIVISRALMAIQF